MERVLKVMLIGEPCVFRACNISSLELGYTEVILRRYTADTWPETSFLTTIGADFMTKTIPRGEAVIKLQVLLFGQTVYLSIRFGSFLAFISCTHSANPSSAVLLALLLSWIRGIARMDFDG